MKKLLLIISIIFLSIIIFSCFNIKSLNKTIENKTYSNEILDKINYVPGYTCKKVNVVREDGSYQGSYSLEDYVGYVVSGETHILDDETTFEAMSVAIRTYTLYATDNCRYPIINSEAHQVMTTVVSDKIKKAVRKTRGQILVYNNDIVISEYDSFSFLEGFHCDKKYCYSTYYKVGSKKLKNPKKHTIKVPSSWVNDLSGGHGNGMSQYGALYLSKKGYDYKSILKYFYADGTEIKTIYKVNTNGLKLDNGNITRNERPLRNNRFYYTNGESNYLEGESNWYVTSRANEILSISSDKKIPYIKKENYCNLRGFVKDYSYTNPRPGSIISWGDHVAIIENVHDGMVDITESYIGLGYYGVELAHEYINPTGIYYDSATNKETRKYNCENNNSGCFKRTNNIKIDDLKNRWGYDFKCYVYLED